MGDSQQFSLRWNNYLRHITCAFDSLRNDEDLVDVTLSCEGKKIRAHKMLLSACSTYFRDLFKENPCQHPVIIFRNVKFEDLSALVDFMYQGEVNVVQDQLSSFLTTAELLAVQGLSEGNAQEVDPSEKESECPLPVQPEVELNSGHLPKHLSGDSSSSPVSYFPVESPPASNKRRNTSEIQPPERARRRLKNADRPAQVLPTPPVVKVEMPDYDDQDAASSCSYGDSNQGTGDALTQLLTQGTDQKPIPDIYSNNSIATDTDTIPHSADSLSAAELSQLLSKPGPSGETQTQDSLQASSEFGTFWTTPSSPLANEDLVDGTHLCKVCGKSFRRQNSLYDHMAFHQGTSQCAICRCVFSRKGNMKRHMRDVHGATEIKTVEDALG